MAERVVVTGEHDRVEHVQDAGWDLGDLWSPAFPSPELVDAAAALLPAVREAAGPGHELAEGPRWYIRIGPGVVEVRSKDYAKADRTAERDHHRHDGLVVALIRYLNPASVCRESSPLFMAVLARARGTSNYDALVRLRDDAKVAVDWAWARGNTVGASVGEVERGLCELEEVQALAAAVAVLAPGGDREPGFPADPVSSRAITEWSAKSRANMVNTLGQLDFTPMYRDRTRLPTMITLTYPGDWLTVAPTGKAVKAHLKAFRLRFERAWQETAYAIWHLEFQGRGAPHVHLLMVPPHGEADGMAFPRWLSRAWAEIVDHPDSEEYRRHLLAGTGVDWAEGLRASDPKRVAVYFSKHGTFRDKEYQHIVPEEWREPGTTPGRFWGYWGLQKHTAVVQVSKEDATAVGRTLRRWSAAQGVTREVTRPRVKGGRVISKYPEVIGLAGAMLVESRPPPKYRRTRTRAGRMSRNRGFVMANDGAVLASQLARYLDQRAKSDMDGLYVFATGDDRYRGTLRYRVRSA